MTDLLHTLPDFPTESYTHLLSSLEKHLITTTDLLTLDALEIAKRAQLPVLDLRRLANHVLSALQADLGLKDHGPVENLPAALSGNEHKESLQKTGSDIVNQVSTISTLDNALDAALGGGIPTGYITEITGESGAGKTQLLLTLLLTAQLPPPHGLSRPTLYISTEAPLPTPRLTQILHTHPLLSPSAASLSRILTLTTPDLESQSHILTNQVPVALARHAVGLVVLDSVAANYRAEYGRSTIAARSAELLALGRLLRGLAREYGCAVVVANQVGDRFAAAAAGAGVGENRIAAAPAEEEAAAGEAGSQGGRAGEGVLALDHQMRFFTGWGAGRGELAGLKTPSLGLVWANQIACRVALVKEAGEEQVESAEWGVRRWRRWMRVVFAPWVAGWEARGGMGVEFEIWGGGVRAVDGGLGGED